MGLRGKRTISQKEPPNLKRFKTDIEAFTQNITSNWADQHGLHQDDQDKTKPISRKQRRKEERKNKKKKNHAFQQRKRGDVLNKPIQKQETSKKTKSKKEKSEKATENKKKKAKAVKHKKKAMEDIRKQGLIEANKLEDKGIRQLEKQLKLKNRKTKSLPKSFMDDGLDYLLDVVDPEKIGRSYDEDDPLDLFTGQHESDDSDKDADDLSDSDGGMDSETDSESQRESDDDIETSSKLPHHEDSVSLTEKKSVKGIIKPLTSGQKTKTKKVQFGECGDAVISQKKVKLKDPRVEEPDSDDSGDEESHDDQQDFSADEYSASENEDEPEARTSVNEESTDDESNSEQSHDDDIEEYIKAKRLKIETKNLKKKVKADREKVFKEDIYGRLRDEHGNIVEGEKSSTHYVPPAKRLQQASEDGKKIIQLERMKKQLKGFLNRLSESNMHSISSKIEEMFRSHSRALLSETLTQLILDACVGPVLVPDRLIMEHTMLVAILHCNVGSEVGAVFLQFVAKQFDELIGRGGRYGDGKEMDNLLVLVAHLFNFKIVHSLLIFDIMKKFTDSFGEKDIELLLLLLKSVGFSLRKDDPIALKEIILRIQTKAASADTSEFEDSSRTTFILDILLAIKNNNMRKIPNYDPSHLDHLRKVHRNFVTGGTPVESQLKISLDDLLHADDRGRWWMVGSAWAGKETLRNQTGQLSQTGANEVNDKILELARQQRMNTDVRKNIFCIIMTSEDFVDAFEKLIKLRLNKDQQREIMHVITDVCLQERVFNPYYAHLAQKFCQYDRQFMMTLQFNVWDKFKEISEMKTEKIHNLACLLTHLIATESMSLSVLKVLEFGELDKAKVVLLKKILTGLLLSYEDATVRDVFGRIARLPKLHLLREGLKLFIQHFLLRTKGKQKEGNEILLQKIDLAEKAMYMGQAAVRM